MRFQQNMTQNGYDLNAPISFTLLSNKHQYVFASQQLEERQISVWGKGSDL
jgi:hypothetical protein